MKALKFIVTGLFFGIVMAKSEAVSWYRIQEMFRFQSFHMFGIIGTALLVGVVAVFMIKHYHIKDFSGNPILFQDKTASWPRYLIGHYFWFGMGVDRRLSGTYVRKPGVWVLVDADCNIGSTGRNIYLWSGQALVTSLVLLN